MASPNKQTKSSTPPWIRLFPRIGGVKCKFNSLSHTAKTSHNPSHHGTCEPPRSTQLRACEIPSLLAHQNWFFWSQGYPDWSLANYWVTNPSHMFTQRHVSEQQHHALHGWTFCPLGNVPNNSGIHNSTAMNSAICHPPQVWIHTASWPSSRAAKADGPARLQQGPQEQSDGVWAQCLNVPTLPPLLQVILSRKQLCWRS